MGGMKEKDGIKPGKYQIAIIATTGGVGGEPVVNYIDPKYFETSTSGLEVEIKGKMTHNITVARPPEGKAIIQPPPKSAAELRWERERQKQEQNQQ